MQNVKTQPTSLTVAEKYKQLRESIGTQAEVAKLMGIARSAIFRREKGQRRITGEVMAAMLWMEFKHGTAEPTAAREARPAPAPANSKPSPNREIMEWDEMQRRYALFVADTQNPHWKNTRMIGSLDGELYEIEAKKKGQLGLVIYAAHLAETFAKYFPGAAFLVSEPEK